MNHAPGAGSIARTLDLQSSALPLYCTLDYHVELVKQNWAKVQPRAYRYIFPFPCNMAQSRLITAIAGVQLIPLPLFYHCLSLTNMPQYDGLAYLTFKKHEIKKKPNKNTILKFYSRWKLGRWKRFPPTFSPYTKSKPLAGVPFH